VTEWLINEDWIWPYISIWIGHMYVGGPEFFDWVCSNSVYQVTDLSSSIPPVLYRISAYLLLPRDAMLVRHVVPVSVCPFVIKPVCYLKRLNIITSVPAWLY